MREFSTIYSSPSIEAAKNLINAFIEFCDICGLEADDMFFFGVFCDVTTYANFPDWESAEAEGIEVPSTLSSFCNDSDTKIDYVNSIIEQVMTGEIEKPEWMNYVEENSVCDWCSQMPSTFLRIIAKEPQYEKLARLLCEFLYSPNRMSSIVGC